MSDDAGEPPKRLVGWARTRLRPGRKHRVSVDVDPRRLAIWDTEHHGWKIPHGRYRVYVGASSRDLRLRDAFAR